MDHIEKVVSRIRQLPALPQNIQTVNNMIDNHHATLDAIGKEIGKDQTLSAQVLKLINSGFYGFSSKISSTSHAVVLLGLNVVRGLVSSSWVSNMIAESFPGVHEHSIACARACFLLARNLGIEDPEDMGTIGLLHDIGKVVIAEHLPEEFGQIKELCRDNRMRFCEAEKQVLGASHSEIARWLLGKWNLPPATVEVIATHHDYDVESECAGRVAVLILANAIVHAEGYICGDDNRMPELPHAALEYLEVKPSDLRPLMDEWVDQMTDLPRMEVLG